MLTQESIRHYTRRGRVKLVKEGEDADRSKEIFGNYQLQVKNQTYKIRTKEKIIF